MFKKHSQFYKPEITEQKKNQIVDVTGWSIGDLKPYEEGARDKAIVEYTDGVQYDFLIPNHKYLLKKSYIEKNNTVLYLQFWNEIIAYKLGRLLDIPVPPAFVGYYNKQDTEPFYGALIEWFYGYEGSDDSAKRGGDIIEKYIRNFERRRGEQHNFKSIIQICTDYKVEDWLESWVKILLLDAIIGNTDRHQDNWHIINYVNDERSYMSPAFDNGTSMGYKVRQEHIEKDLKKLTKYINKGRHHMKYAIADKNKAGHIELLQKIVYDFPEIEVFIKDILSTDISIIGNHINELCEFDIRDDKYKLTKKRADFITNIIIFRYHCIRKEFKL